MLGDVKTRPLLLGLAQMRIVMGDKEANVRAAEEAVLEAARAGCDLVVLPECPLAGWTSPRAARAAEAVPGPFTRRLARLARKHRVAIASGIEEAADGRVYNAAVLLDRSGDLKLLYRKINELEIGLRVYARGDRLGVVDLDGRRVGLSICADSWRPEITDALALMGADLVLSPSAWAVDPGGEATNLAWIREQYRLRTLGRRLTIAAPNSVGDVTQGPWKGRLLQGTSLVTGPRGRLLLEGPVNRPALLTCRV
jgi:predicted amidohydrolase